MTGLTQVSASAITSPRTTPRVVKAILKIPSLIKKRGSKRSGKNSTTPTKEPATPFIPQLEFEEDSPSLTTASLSSDSYLSHESSGDLSSLASTASLVAMANQEQQEEAPLAFPPFDHFAPVVQNESPFFPGLEMEPEEPEMEPADTFYFAPMQSKYTDLQSRYSRRGNDWGYFVDFE
ncbi:hypothetical protein SEMRO_145_G067240.1 [Seminavis robusta]|uniref:Uncharacterized protein n=1 Tax=Seminavis robusta TaxID=568900 RepID=A0A9N8H6F6_9STRA|nr:hypothetical protein SEMRO_145_G067240.1 [Seminavis robusta]|eukprot:Sro145_g067240.1 n/a (178) ;mRNA; r:33244-33777